MRLFAALLLPTAVSAAITVTPYCKNSLRVQITPPTDDVRSAASAPPAPAECTPAP